MGELHTYSKGREPPVERKHERKEKKQRAGRLAILLKHYSIAATQSTEGRFGVSRMSVATVTTRPSLAECRGQLAHAAAHVVVTSGVTSD
mmetsp:Transcript_3544/g.7734  ORF Transcript_3544/g.7734 Transcript_3544/m.7734 type:complete len:90 (-) Transcript_3544:30-299(-)